MRATPVSLAVVALLDGLGGMVHIYTERARYGVYKKRGGWQLARALFCLSRHALTTGVITRVRLRAPASCKHIRVDDCSEGGCCVPGLSKIEW